MSTFNEKELAFLRDGPKLGRLATVDAAGDPHVVPTGWSYNTETDTIDVGGMALERTQKYRNVARSGRAAIVIDDVLPPWRPRAVLVRGAAEALDGLIRLHPEQVISWGIESDRIGQRSSRRVAPDRAGGDGGTAARELRFVVQVDAYDDALRLFRDVFGLETVKVLDEQGGRGVILRLPSATLEVIDREHTVMVDGIEAGHPVDERLRIAVNVADLARAGDRVQAAGATPTAAPVIMPWGDHNQRFRTEDGLQLTLFQSPT